MQATHARHIISAGGPVTVGSGIAHWIIGKREAGQFQARQDCWDGSIDVIFIQSPSKEEKNDSHLHKEGEEEQEQEQVTYSIPKDWSIPISVGMVPLRKF